MTDTQELKREASTLTVSLEDYRIKLYYDYEMKCSVEFGTEVWVWLLGRLLPVLYLRIGNLDAIRSKICVTSIGECRDECVRQLLGVIDYLELLGSGVDILNKIVEFVGYEGPPTNSHSVTIRLSKEDYLARRS